MVIPSEVEEQRYPRPDKREGARSAAFAERGDAWLFLDFARNDMRGVAGEREGAKCLE